MKNKIKVIIIIIFLIVSLTMFMLLKDRIVFEYYVWNLNSESYDIREENAVKIIALGKDAIPKLLDKLDRKYIYETNYVVYCLEEITNVRGKYRTTDSAISYWKNWGREKKYLK